MVRSLGESGVVAALMGCGEEVGRGEAVVGALAAGRSRRESRAWRGGRMSNVEGEGRGGWEVVGVMPPEVGAAEGILWICQFWMGDEVNREDLL